MRGEEGETVYLGHRDVLIVLAALAGVAFAFERADSYLVLGTFMAVILLLVARASLWKVAAGRARRHGPRLGDLHACSRACAFPQVISGTFSEASAATKPNGR